MLNAAWPIHVKYLPVGYCYTERHNFATLAPPCSVAKAMAACDYSFSARGRCFPALSLNVQEYVSFRGFVAPLASRAVGIAFGDARPERLRIGAVGLLCSVTPYAMTYVVIFKKRLSAIFFPL